MHVAQVVAGRVLAQCHELAGGLDATADVRMIAVEVEPADLGRRDDVVHARVDDHFLGGKDASGGADQPERIGQRGAQRPHLVAAPTVGGEAIRGPGLFARTERCQEEARCSPAAVEGIGDGQRCGAARPGTDDEVDPSVDADLKAFLEVALGGQCRRRARTQTYATTTSSAAAMPSTASWTRPSSRDPTYRPAAAPINDHPRRVSMRRC